jgi:ribonuclease BN (tRNA processing enzyme)
VKEARIRAGRWQAMSEKEQREYVCHMVEEHLTPDRIGPIAARAGVKTVILSHLTPRPDTDDYTPWADEVKKHFSGQVSVGKDLMEFE